MDVAIAYNVLRTSRQLYLHTRRLLYATNTLIFTDPIQLKIFLNPNFPTYSMITFLSAELHLTQRQDERRWEAVLNLALRYLINLRSLNVRIHIEIDPSAFEKHEWMPPPENNEPILFSEVPLRPCLLQDADIVIIATEWNWLAYLGISLNHLFSQERTEVLAKQEAWIKKVTARLTGKGTAS